MKKSLLRATALLLSALTLILSVAPLVSCGFSDEEEAEFLSIAREQITLSETLNEIYFGAGIPHDPDHKGVGVYYYADEEYLKDAGFSNIKELKDLTATVFSEEYCNIIYQSAFEGVNDENFIVYARYSNSETLSDTSADRTAQILVNTSYEPYDGMLAYEREYDLDSIEITKVRKHTVTVKIKVTYSVREGYTDQGKLAGSREREIIFTRPESGGYRINTPTY